MKSVESTSLPSSWDPAVARTLITAVATLPGALLPALHALQDHFGYVDDLAVPLLAEVLNLSRAEVHGVMTFYDYFRTSPPGRRTLRICRAEACQAMNANVLLAHAKQRLGVGLHATTPDGAVTLEPVYCLGNCGCGPAVMLDDRLYGRVTAARLDELLSEESCA